MSSTDTRSTRELFRAWRSGDGEAGQVMAQRFADWYYAIATSRLGESRGRGPCDAACAAFGQGIVGVTESRALVAWAHELIATEVAKAGARATDGDEPSAFTGNQKPKPLLQRARQSLPDEIALLEAVYMGQESDEVIERMAAPQGGVPLGILKARYAVKQWLRDQANVPFEVAPDNPVLDRAPLPLYEADKMASPDEESQFEQWMLTDIDLCKDIAEFAHFSIALRGGIPAGAPPAEASRPKAATAPTTFDDDLEPSGSSSSKAAMGIGLVVAVVLVLAILAGVGVVAAMYLM